MEKCSHQGTMKLIKTETKDLGKQIQAKFTWKCTECGHIEIEVITKSKEEIKKNIK